MSQHVITTSSAPIPAPSIPAWRRRSVVVAVLVALLAGGAGAAIGALVSSDSSVTYRSVPAPAASAASATTPVVCASSFPPDWGSLLVVLGETPGGAQAAASLSPQALQLVGAAAHAAADSASISPMPDAPTLATALAHLSAADRQVVLGLVPEMRADVEASLNSIGALPGC